MSKNINSIIKEQMKYLSEDKQCQLNYDAARNNGDYWKALEKLCCKYKIDWTITSDDYHQTPIMYCPKVSLGNSSPEELFSNDVTFEQAREQVVNKVTTMLMHL